MTAVEWLFEQVCNLDWRNIVGEEKLKLFQQAKEIEKQQIIDAYDAGLFDGTMDDVNDRMYKQYYNETFNK